MNPIVSLWMDTQKAIRAGQFTPREWIRHMARESRLPGSELGPLRQRKVNHHNEAAVV